MTSPSVAAVSRPAAATPSVARSAVWGMASFVVTIAITFYQTPFILAALGDSRYGTWTLIGQVTGYYGLLDLGTRGAIAHFVSRHLAADAPSEANRYISAGLTMLTLAGLIVLLTGGLLLWGFPSLFTAEGVNPIEVRSALAVMLAVVALTLPFEVAGAIIQGCRRPELGTVFDTVLRFAAFGAIVLALRSGGGLLALALIQASTRAAGWLYLSYQARRLFPDVALAPSLRDREPMRDLFGYGSRTVLVSLSRLVISRLDVVVVGAFVGVRAVTVYVLGQTILTYLSNFVSVITRPFTAHFTHHHAKGDRSTLIRLYLDGSRFSAAAACSLSSLAISFAAPFLALWVGAEYVTGTWRERSDIVMIALLVGQIPRMVQSISWQLLFGLKEAGALARLLAVEALANVALSLLFVHWFGLVGVALGSVVPMLLTNLFRLPKLVCRRLDLDARTYARRGPGRGVLAGGLTLALGLAIESTLTLGSWPRLLGAGAVTAAGSALAVWLIVLTADERTRVSLNLSRRIGLAP